MTGRRVVVWLVPPIIFAGTVVVARLSGFSWPVSVLVAAAMLAGLWAISATRWDR